MFPDFLYTPLYIQVMLLVVIGCVVLYWERQTSARSLTQFNWIAMVGIAVAVIVFMGFRPVSAAFVDMTDYALDYAKVQQGGEGRFNDPLFNGLMRLCAPVLPMAGFFFVCALIYVLPIALACWRVHGSWAFPVFLACLTAFSFWAYGVNGIRNGMATSVLLLAFAFHDKPIVMLTLMVAAWGFHGAVLLPAGAFLIVRYVKWSEIWLAFWALCVVVTFFAGNVGEMLLSRYNPFAWDDRVDQYILGATAAGGFRADFLAYSIVPVLATLLLAAPIRARTKRMIKRVQSGPALASIGNRSALGANGVGIAMRAWQAQGRVASPGSAGVTPADSAGVSPAAGTPALQRVPASSNRIRSVPEAMFSDPRRSPRTGLPAVCKTLPGQACSLPRAALPQSGWNSLPWVQFLRSDPFYARLVNTYLLANAIWVLMIHASFSNRFAYLSWFMLPWVLLYPFVPGQILPRPRIALIAAVLAAQYAFTYFMWTVVYRMRV